MTAFTTHTRGKQNCKYQPNKQLNSPYTIPTSWQLADRCPGGADVDGVGPIPPPPLNVSEIAAISGVRDGHRNRKSQKSLRFRCAKFQVHDSPHLQCGAFCKRANKKHPKKSNTKIFFRPPHRPPSKIFVFAFFLYFKEKTQHEHKEFRGLKAPKKGGFGHGILGEIFVFGCPFRP